MVCRSWIDFGLSLGKLCIPPTTWMTSSYIGISYYTIKHLQLVYRSSKSISVCRIPNKVNADDVYECFEL